MHGSKTCFKCNNHLPLTEFYKHSEMQDGHLNKCKECNKADVRKNREDKIHYYREYDKQRANLPKRVEGRAEYAKSEEGKISQNKAKVKWGERNPIKKAASTLFGNWLRYNQESKKDKCESCDSEHPRMHAHHDDYMKPFDVRWLCPKCHSKWHKENGEGKNG
jgi:hypothetical protein